MRIHVRADLIDAYRADLPGGIRGPARVRVTAVPNGSGLAHRVDLTVELIGDRYTVTDLRCRPVEGGPPIDSAALRAVPITTIVFEALRPFVLVGDSSVNVEGVRPQPLEAGPDDVADGPTDAALAKVAAVYALVWMIGGRPTQTVADHFGIKRATVGRWIMRCRERGFLGPAAPGRAGECSDG